MTAHFHDPATHGLETAPVVRTAVRRSTTFTRPRGLRPGGCGEAGRGHSLHGADADDEEDLSHRSSGAQPGPARSTAEFDPRTLDDTTPMSETEDHDQRAHGC